MDKIFEWLIEGDISIQYQTRKYLMEEPLEYLVPLRRRISEEGWGTVFLSKRNSSGHWSRDFYQVKWVNSHYTLLDLRYLEIEPVQPIIETLNIILDKCKASDGSINESHTLICRGYFGQDYSFSTFDFSYNYGLFTQWQDSKRWLSQ